MEIRPFAIRHSLFEIMYTQAVEDYLKTIYELQAHHKTVSTTMLADHLSIAPASVTGMLKKLAEMRLVDYARYQGVTLTPTGEKIALEVVRHHRLIELYLAEALGVPWDKVHDEAEKWEHVLSEDIEERIDRFLGSPRWDPHGAPIPDKSGNIEQRPRVRLCDITHPQDVRVLEVSDHDPELLRYLGKLNIYPQTDLTILSIEPFDKSMTVRHQQSTHTLSALVTSYIWVLPEEHMKKGQANAV